MPTTNPFKVLGITPEGLRGLGDEEIEKLVGAMHRFWSLLYHPDRQRPRSEAKFKAVGWAKEQLDQKGNAAAYLDWKTRYLKRRKDQLADLDAQLNEAAAEQAALQDHLRDFWRVYALGEQALEAGEFSVFALPPCLMLCSDTLMSRLRRSALPREATFSDTSNAPGTSVELEVDEDGVLTRRILLQRFFDHRAEEVPEDVPEEWVEVRKHPGPKSYYWERTDEQRVLEGIRIVGAIPEGALRAAGDTVSKFQALMTGDVTHLPERAAEAIRKGFDWESFVLYAGLMSPILTRYVEVIGMSGGSSEDVRFHFLGKPRKFHLM